MADLNKVKELPKAQRLTLKLRSEDGKTLRTVDAALPDGFGLSVGSSFTDPNNTDVGNQSGGAFGTIASGVKSLTRRQGFSTKITQASNIFYDGPEPTEISFDLNFHAYYSAFNEVMKPVFDLMMMSVGSEYTLEEINNNTNSNKLQSILETTGVDAGKYGFIGRPGEAKVTFGRAMTIPRCYVASVGVEFSNIMDNQDFPISANCSVTIKVIRNPTQAELTNYFHRGEY